MDWSYSADNVAAMRTASADVAYLLKKKPLFPCLLAALAMLLGCAGASNADQFNLTMDQDGSWYMSNGEPQDGITANPGSLFSTNTLYIGAQVNIPAEGVTTVHEDFFYST